MSALLLLRAVTTTCLLAVADTLGVQGTRDVRGDLDLAGQPDTGDLAQSGVWLLGGGRVDARADPPALRAALKRRGVVLGYLVLPALPDQLLDRGHRVSVFLSVPFGTGLLQRAFGTACSITTPSGATSLSRHCVFRHRASA